LALAAPLLRVGEARALVPVRTALLRVFPWTCRPDRTTPPPQPFRSVRAAAGAPMARAMRGSPEAALLADPAEPASHQRCGDVPGARQQPGPCRGPRHRRPAWLWRHLCSESARRALWCRCALRQALATLLEPTSSLRTSLSSGLSLAMLPSRCGQTARRMCGSPKSDLLPDPAEPRNRLAVVLAAGRRHQPGLSRAFAGLGST